MQPIAPSDNRYRMGRCLKGDKDERALRGEYQATEDIVTALCNITEVLMYQNELLAQNNQILSQSIQTKDQQIQNLMTMLQQERNK